MALNIEKYEKEYKNKQANMPLRFNESVGKIRRDIQELEQKISVAREAVEGLGVAFEGLDAIKLLVSLQQDIASVKDLLLNLDSFLVQLRGNADAEAELIAAAQAKLRSL